MHHSQGWRNIDKCFIQACIFHTCVRIKDNRCMHHTYMGHSCKIGNMRPPGTLENPNPQFEQIYKFGLLFVWSYHTQWGKNAGPPHLTHKPFFVIFFVKSDVPGGQNEIYSVVVTWNNHTFAMFWLYLFINKVTNCFQRIFNSFLNCHIDRLFHFCPPGTFDRNEFLLWLNIFLDKYFHIEG